MKSMQELIQLVENATRENPLDVTAIIKDEDDYTITMHSGTRIGSLEKKEDGRYEFCDAEPNFKEYEGMDFEDVETAEEFFKEMTKNVDPVYENHIYVVNENDADDGCIVYNLPESEYDDMIEYLNESVFGSEFNTLKAYKDIPDAYAPCVPTYPHASWNEFKRRFDI
jgi:hypothetical protein